MGEFSSNEKKIWFFSHFVSHYSFSECFSMEINQQNGKQLGVCVCGNYNQPEMNKKNYKGMKKREIIVANEWKEFRIF